MLIFSTPYCLYLGKQQQKHYVRSATVSKKVENLEEIKVDEVGRVWLGVESNANNQNS